jgi:4-amino-4-deoxy-L-arabinose transferase-like glycosyltransferase
VASIDASAGGSAVAMNVRSLPRDGRRVAFGALLLVCAVTLFVKLGAPALLEPDEGRNAEKAREILLLHDWVTPHENFLVVLDKPIFYYWLVAASYKAFGVSEWSARLPSALAGTGCVILVFLLGRRFFGLWEGLWSALILVTSVEFYLLSRIVIFDMALTFFITLSLFLFLWATREENSARRRLLLGLMYSAFGAATLVKGPIGVVLPSLVISAELIVSRKFFLLRTLELPLGALIFCAIVAPWYYEVELRNPGYLSYFLWEENFIRYLTPHFNRGQGWYYFFIVLAVGFFPWTLCVPEVIKQAWRRRGNENTRFLILWAALPFIFFSFSHAKLPHYILPMYPPLALLTGIVLESKLTSAEPRRSWVLALSCLVLLASIVCFILGAVSPDLVPRAARGELAGVSPFLRALGLLAVLGLSGLLLLVWTARWKIQASVYIGFGLGLFVYILLVGQVLTSESVYRSTREFVQKVLPRIDTSTQIVIYDTSLESLPFYLKITQPIWIVWSGEKASVMGSFYLAEEGAQSASGFGRALLSFDEFKEQWTKTPTKPLAIFLKQKNLSRLEQEMPNVAKQVVEFDDLAFVTN